MRNTEVILKRANVYEEKAKSALQHEIFKAISETLVKDHDLSSELWEYYVYVDMANVTFPIELFDKVGQKIGVDAEEVRSVYDEHEDEIKELLSHKYGDIQGERYSESVNRGY